LLQVTVAALATVLAPNITSALNNSAATSLAGLSLIRGEQGNPSKMK
jgi:hypothetical protein